MSGGGGAIGQSLVDTGMKFGGKAPTQQGGVGYTPTPASNPYQSAFNSQQQAPQQSRMSPFVQQQMMRQQPQQMNGLQAAMMQLMGQYNQPMMRRQMPQYMQRPQMSPMAYRPDISSARASLNNVAPSVELQQRIAAEEAARLQAEQDAYNAANPQPTNDMGWSGGG
jgi:hypothetical protein